MSGNASRKHKQYMKRKEDRLLFGDIRAKDHCGITDLTAFSAARGEIIIRKQNHNMGRCKTKAL